MSASHEYDNGRGLVITFDGDGDVTRALLETDFLDLTLDITADVQKWLRDFSRKPMCDSTEREVLSYEELHEWFITARDRDNWLDGRDAGTLEPGGDQ